MPFGTPAAAPRNFKPQNALQPQVVTCQPFFACFFALLRVIVTVCQPRLNTITTTTRASVSHMLLLLLLLLPRHNRQPNRYHFALVASSLPLAPTRAHRNQGPCRTGLGQNQEEIGLVSPFCKFNHDVQPRVAFTRNWNSESRIQLEVLEMQCPP